MGEIKDLSIRTALGNDLKKNERGFEFNGYRFGGKLLLENKSWKWRS
jgi:hypothetical protein